MAMDMVLKAIIENKINDKLTESALGQLSLENIEINSDGELLITVADSDSSGGVTDEVATEIEELVSTSVDEILADEDTTEETTDDSTDTTTTA